METSLVTCPKGPVPFAGVAPSETHSSTVRSSKESCSAMLSVAFVTHKLLFLSREDGRHGASPGFRCCHVQIRFPGNAWQLSSCQVVRESHDSCIT